MKHTSRVVVVFEDAPTRQVAVLFCDQLVRHYWQKCAFQFTWLSNHELEEKGDATGETAAGADLIVLSFKRDAAVPREAGAWLECWTHKRAKREGVLILLNGTQGGVGTRGADHAFLRAMAHRAGMDFLTELPTNMLQAMPESLDSYKERAGQMTTCLDEILRQQQASLRMRTVP